MSRAWASDNSRRGGSGLRILQDSRAGGRTSVNRAAIPHLSGDDLGWAIAGLQRYVNYRRVDAEFLRLLALSDAPGELIEPDDPAYGQQVFDALMGALEKRIATRLRARPGEKADEKIKALIRRHIPSCSVMMEGLEDLAIGYEVIRLTIDGEDRLPRSGDNA